jgi:ABC-2 type transport system ATP-binding protein
MPVGEEIAMQDPSLQGVLALETRGLGKRFGPRWAVAELELRVEPGVIYGFLGRNGAGKTTAIRLILGLLRPTAGSVTVFGADVARDRIAAARQVGSLLEARATYDHLTGRENLDMTRRLLSLPASEIDRVLEMVEMSGAAHRMVGHYSLGMRQRLGLARALLGRPHLLILDEPMNGLDPDGIRDMREAIRALPERSGATVLLSSHLLAEVEQTATHIGLMGEGRLLMQGPIGELLQRAGPELYLRADDPAAARRLLEAGGWPAEPDGEGLVVRLDGHRDAPARINRALVEAGLQVSELTPRTGSLESLYLRMQQPKEAA